MQSKISSKENGVFSFNSQDNGNTFCRFFSKLAHLVLQKLPRPKNKFEIKTTEYEDFVLCNVDVITVDKILNSSYVGKTSGIDQISAKFLKDGALVIAIHLANINVSIKLDTFTSKCKIAKIKPLFKKGI